MAGMVSRRRWREGVAVACAVVLLVTFPPMVAAPQRPDRVTAGGVPVQEAPVQQWGSAASGGGDLAGGPGNSFVPRSLRQRFPLLAEAADPVAPANPATVERAEALAAKGYVAGESVELTQLREAHTRTYENADGTRTTEFSATPLHRREDADSWVPVDTGLVAAGSGWRTSDTAAGIAVASRADARHLVSVDLGEASVGYGVAGAASVPGEVDGGKVVYRDALPATDIELEMGAESVKETLVLRSAGAPAAFTFPLSLSGLSARVSPDGLRWAFTFRTADQQSRLYTVSSMTALAATPHATFSRQVLPVP